MKKDIHFIQCHRFHDMPDFRLDCASRQASKTTAIYIMISLSIIELIDLTFENQYHHIQDEVSVRLLRHPLLKPHYAVYVHP